MWKDCWQNELKPPTLEDWPVIKKDFKQMMDAITSKSFTQWTVMVNCFFVSCLLIYRQRKTHYGPCFFKNRIGLNQGWVMILWDPGTCHFQSYSKIPLVTSTTYHFSARGFSSYLSSLPHCQPTRSFLQRRLQKYMMHTSLWCVPCI